MAQRVLVLGAGFGGLELATMLSEAAGIDFLSGPERTGTFNPPSAAQVAAKERFDSKPPRPLVRLLACGGRAICRS